MAHADPLVMHAVLALSGIHLVHGKEIPEIEQETYAHYGTVLKELKYLLTEWVSGSRGNTLNLLLITTLMCICEASTTTFFVRFFR